MRNYLFLFTLIVLLFACEKSATESGAYGRGPIGQGGSMARFTVVGNYLYAVDEEKLNVFDITQAASPVFKKAVPVGFEIETIYPFKDKLFIGSTSMVHIFSIDDPANPQKLSEAISPDVIRRCDPVVAKDYVAYATLRTSGPCGGISSVLAVYDITNITRPVQKATIAVSEPYGLGYLNNTLYVCDKTNGLLVFDITKPYNPVLLKSLKDGDYVDVIPYANVLICWTTKGMLLYDVSDNRNPVRLTEIN